MKWMKGMEKSPIVFPEHRGLGKKEYQLIEEEEIFHWGRKECKIGKKSHIGENKILISNKGRVIPITGKRECHFVLLAPLLLLNLSVIHGGMIERESGIWVETWTDLKGHMKGSVRTLIETSLGLEIETSIMKETILPWHLSLGGHCLLCDLFHLFHPCHHFRPFGLFHPFVHVRQLELCLLFLLSRPWIDFGRIGGERRGTETLCMREIAMKEI